MDGDDCGLMCRDGPRRKGSANAELGDSATNGNYSVKAHTEIGDSVPIQSSATVCGYRDRRQCADTELGDSVPIPSSARNESADTAGVRRGTRVPIQSSARNGKTAQNF